MLSDGFRGALLGGAVGAVLASSSRGGEMRRLARERAVPGCSATAETRLVLATARSLIDCRGFDAEHMAAALAPHSQATGGFLAYGNGGAVRIAPVGMLCCANPQTAAALGGRVAKVTHAHPIGQDGAGLLAALVADLLSSPRCEALGPARIVARLEAYAVTRRFRDMLSELAALRGASSRTVVDVLGNGREAHRSVLTAIHAFLCHADSFSGAVQYAISLGGDAGAIGTMTGTLAGARAGASTIPAEWVAHLEVADELSDAANALLGLTLREH